MTYLHRPFLAACLFAGVAGLAQAQAQGQFESRQQERGVVHIQQGGYAASSRVQPADQDSYEEKRSIIQAAERKKELRRQKDAEMVRQAGNTPPPAVVHSDH